MLHLSASLAGQSVTITLTNGAIVEGVFHTVTPFHSMSDDKKNRYILKEIKIVDHGSSNNNDNSNGNNDQTEVQLQDGKTLCVPISKVLQLHAKQVSLENDIGSSSSGGDAVHQQRHSGATGGDGFVTDVQISAGGLAGEDQELVAAGSAWTAAGAGGKGGKFQALGSGGGGGAARSVNGGGQGGGGRQQQRQLQQPVNSRAAALGGPGKASAAATTGTSSTGGNLSGSIGQWDQFKANEELFNVNATFDENLYTTQLDTSQIDARKIAEAERIAREIENSTTTNIHLKEERGQKIEIDYDEEDLYSGVLTNEMKQRHEAAQSTSVEPSKENDKQVASPTSKAGSSAGGPKKMNYAAAAAKADGTKKAAPPGFSSSSTAVASSSATLKPKSDVDKDANEETPPSVVAPTPATEETNKDSVTKDEKGKSASLETKKSTASDEVVPAETKPPEDGTKVWTKDPSKPSETGQNVGLSTKDDGNSSNFTSKDEPAKNETKNDAIKTSKLNANAKAFTFNPTAKSFTPSFGGGGGTQSVSVPPQQPPQHMADPNMQMYGGGHPMNPHYMPTAAMGQPGRLKIVLMTAFQSCFVD